MDSITRYADGRCYLVCAETAHLPHVRVTWYDSGVWGHGAIAVLPGETGLQAAVRMFGYTIAPRWIDASPVQPIIFEVDFDRLAEKYDRDYFVQIEYPV